MRQIGVCGGEIKLYARLQDYAVLGPRIRLAEGREDADRWDYHQLSGGVSRTPCLNIGRSSGDNVIMRDEANWWSLGI